MMKRTTDVVGQAPRLPRRRTTATGAVALQLALLAVLYLAFTAQAELCGKCKDGMYIMNIGSCVDCKGTTRSGAFKLCGACSAKHGQCEHCLAPLTPPAAARAELCPNCTGRAYDQKVGVCSRCGGTTCSDGFTLCNTCSVNLGQCLRCRAALGGAAKPAGDNAQAQLAKFREQMEKAQPGCTKSPGVAVEQKAAAVAAKWLEALSNKDVVAVLAVSATPFDWDGKVVGVPDQPTLEAKLNQLETSKPPLKFSAPQFVCRRAVDGVGADLIWMMASTQVGTRDEAFVLFVIPGAEPKIVGFRD